MNREKGRTNQKLLENLIKSHALRSVTGEGDNQEDATPARPGAETDMFRLAPLPEVDKG